MIREIKFRGKLPDTGGWVYGYYCKHIKRQVCPMGDELKPEDIAHLIINDGFADWNMPRSLQGYDVDPETVGQYTGIKIGGQKLFEHDVVRYRETGSDDWQYGVVVWCGDRDYPAFDVEPWIDCDCNGLSYIVTVCEAEIIGNKWDNPELLEVLGDEIK